jgi:hypothetical protein
MHETRNVIKWTLGVRVNVAVWLQVRIKFEANAVLDALAQIDTLTRGQSTLTRGHQRSRAIGNSL